ncbi:heavy metal-associated domain containing protein [Iris pallida]|uniref:Heavy metal-associated domain containing protein n=1 Tax=Iris pallida TaxID=29817 RepID=A0AAX6DL84_IRIPA|nr:heavy metal-associated domain containing protein [Iris pallida]KAJ6851022.1 heavy metal-associated domain containing protein [Iris pallida]
MSPSSSPSWRQLSPRRPRCPSSCETSRASSWEIPSPTRSFSAKMVLKVPVNDAKKRSKAMKEAATMSGFVSVQLEGDHMVVVGDGMDAVELVARLRKRVGHTELVSIYVGLLGPGQDLFLDA